MQRELSRFVARPAMPRPLANGWWLGVLTEALAPQGEADCDIIVWDATAAEWVYADQTITIRDFWLNDTDDDIAIDTRIKPVWYRNVWTYDQAYCEAADNLPE